MNMLQLLAIILPIIAIFCVLIIASVNFYFLIRKRYPIKVNCWFCNKYTQVNYAERNSFYCLSCQQYNGFNEDGGYNRQIPEQYDEMLNRRSAVTYVNGRTTNGLCRFCNNNQQLKVHQLAAFVPLNEKSYDIEIAHFKNLLEKAYKLCPKCEQVLHHTLSEQNNLLIGQRILSMHKKSMAFLDINKSTKHVTSQQKKVFFNFLLYFTLILISILLLVETIHNSNISEQAVKQLLPGYLHPYISYICEFLRRIYNIYKYYFESVNNMQEVQEIYNYLNSTLTPVKAIINNTLNMKVTHNQYLDYFIVHTPAFLNGVQFYEIALSICGLFLQSCTFLLRKHNLYITVVWIFLLVIPYVPLAASSVATAKMVVLVIILYTTISHRRLRTTIKPSPNILSSSSLTDSNVSLATNLSDTSTSDLSASTNYFDISNSSKTNFRDFNSSGMSSTKSRKSTRSINRTRHLNDSPKSMFGSKAVIENPLENTSFHTRGFITECSIKKNIDTSDIRNGLMNLSLGRSNIKPSYQHVNNIFRSKGVLSPPSFVYNNYYSNRPSSWCTENWLKREELHPFRSRSSSQTSGFVSIEPNDLNRSLPNSASSSVCDDFDRSSIVSEPIPSSFRSCAFSTKSGININRSTANISNMLKTTSRFNTNNKRNDVRLFKPIVYNSDHLSNSDLD